MQMFKIAAAGKEEMQIFHREMQQIRSFASAFALILAIILTAFLIQHLNPQVSQPGSFGFWGALFLIGCWLTILVPLRRKLFLIFTSYQFAVSILAFSTVAVMLGTFVIQNAPPEEYLRLYGESLTAIIQNFFLFDLFHSLWFGSLLILIAVSLFLVLTKRNPFRLTQLGFLFSHGGIILILAGALMGFYRGEKGMIHLNEGDSASSLQIVKNNAYTGETGNLGFSLKLEDFQVDYYKGDYKIYAYRLDQSDGRYRAIGSYKIREGRRHKIPGSDTDFRIAAFTSGEFPTVNVEIASPEGKHFGVVTNRVEAPLILNEGEIVLMMDKRDDEVKEYRSLVSVYEGGIRQRQEVIQVNHPLKHKGFSFYQSNFDPDNLAYSGLQVVRDPGLSIVYGGFLFVGIGVVFIFYVRPRVVEAGRRKQRGVSHVR